MQSLPADNKAPHKILENNRSESLERKLTMMTV